MFHSLLHCYRRGVIEYGGLVVFLGAGEKRGLDKEKRGSSGIKVALQIEYN